LEAPSGTELPISPEFKANMTGRYTFNFNNLDAFIQTSLVYQSEVFNDIRSAGDEERRLIGNSDAYLMADFSAGIEQPNWTLTFYVNNLTDERAELARYAECATQVCASDDSIAAPGGPAVYIVPVQPRTFGIRFGQRF
jgi:outer membrane receptor protein involved in Fe transport